MYTLPYVLHNVFEDKIPLEAPCMPLVPPAARKKIKDEIVDRFDGYKTMSINDFISLEPEIALLSDWWLSTQGSLFLYGGPYPKENGTGLSWIMLLELDILDWLKSQSKDIKTFLSEKAFFKNTEHPVFGKLNIHRYWQNVQYYQVSKKKSKIPPAQLIKNNGNTGKVPDISKPISIKLKNNKATK